MSLSKLFQIAYRRTRRADDRMVARVLQLAEVCPTSEIGAELDALLRQRMSDCRDLFVLRGVRPKRLSVLRLAGQRIAQDAACAERMAQVSPRHGRHLLRAICVLVEAVGKTGFPPRRRAAARSQPVAAAAPTKLSTPVVEAVAANDAELASEIDLHDAADALRIVHRQLQGAAASSQDLACPERLAA